MLRVRILRNIFQNHDYNKSYLVKWFLTLIWQTIITFVSRYTSLLFISLCFSFNCNFILSIYYYFLNVWYRALFMCNFMSSWTGWRAISGDSNKTPPFMMRLLGAVYPTIENWFEQIKNRTYLPIKVISHYIMLTNYSTYIHYIHVCPQYFPSILKYYMFLNKYH